MPTLVHALLSILLALGVPGGDWWEDDPFACPQPEEPNCGAPNGAGGWEVDPVEDAQAADPVASPPTYAG